MNDMIHSDVGLWAKCSDCGRTVTRVADILKGKFKEVGTENPGFMWEFTCSKCCNGQK